MKRRIFNKYFHAFNFSIKDRVKVKNTEDTGTVIDVNGIYINVKWDDQVETTRGEVYLSNQLEKIF